MKKLTLTERIETFLRLATSDFNLCVHKADDQEGETYLLFNNLEDKESYISKKIEADILRLWSIPHLTEDKIKPHYGFSLWTQDPGVRYHKDGSGTPPSDDLVDYNETFRSMLKLLQNVAKFLNQINVSNAEENWLEYDMELEMQQDE